MGIDIAGLIRRTYINVAFTLTEKVAQSMTCILHRWICCIVFTVLGGTVVCAPPVCAQAPSSEPLPNEPPGVSGRWVPSFRSMGQNALDIAEAPFELSTSQTLLTLGSTGLVLSAVSTLDRPVYDQLHAQSGRSAALTGPLAAPGRWYDRADPDRVIMGTAGLLAASGLVLRRRAWTRTSVRLVEAIVYTKLVTGLAKSVLNRSRPFATPHPFAATPGAFDSDHEQLSMPSGHTARAFAAASVLAHQADRWYVSVPAYGIATSVALERVRSGDHWMTDVMVGGALGYLIGRSVSSSSGPDEVTYAPIFGTKRVGLSVRF